MSKGYFTSTRTYIPAPIRLKTVFLGIEPLFNPTLLSLAPLIYNVKPAVLLNCGMIEKPSEPDIISNYVWKALSLCSVSALTIHTKVLFSCHHRLSVLFYNRDYLRAALAANPVQSYLESLGFVTTPSVLDGYLEGLSQRFQHDCFPHEIGLFLGIPLEDVQGFIEHQGKGYLFSKYWKVYAYPERAQRLFALYDWAKWRLISSCLREF